jgi:GH15 family glucan-1,4-alpha-glucosidase
MQMGPIHTASPVDATSADLDSAVVDAVTDCGPSFDAPSMFGSLLDANRGGYFQLAAAVLAKTRQFYHPDTNVLIIRFFADDGGG